MASKCRKGLHAYYVYRTLGAFHAVRLLGIVLANNAQDAAHKARNQHPQHRDSIIVSSSPNRERSAYV